MKRWRPLTNNNLLIPQVHPFCSTIAYSSRSPKDRRAQPSRFHIFITSTHSFCEVLGDIPIDAVLLHKLISDLKEEECKIFLDILAKNSMTTVEKIQNLDRETFEKLTENQFLLNALQKLRATGKQSASPCIFHMCHPSSLISFSIHHT